MLTNPIVAHSLLEITFNISYDNQTGTCFCLTLNGKQYIITARHLFPKSSHNDVVTINIWQNDHWHEISSNLLLHKNSQIDIAVLPIQGFLSKAYEIRTDVNLTIGMDLAFLGFPYGLRQSSGELNRGFPFPLVKKAILSGWFGENKVIGLYLDGHNNPGFSGGLIGYSDFRKKENVIVGVVSAYVNQSNEIITPFGNFPSNENSGIVVGYGINHVFEILEN